MFYFWNVLTFYGLPALTSFKFNSDTTTSNMGLSNAVLEGENVKENAISC